MPDPYTEVLRSCASKLDKAGASARISGEGAGSFLVAELGPRGFELYRGEGDAVVIDPTEGELLKGEIVFPSYSKALEAGLRWLQEGTA